MKDRLFLLSQEPWNRFEVQIADGEMDNRLQGKLGRKAGEIETELMTRLLKKLNLSN